MTINTLSVTKQADRLYIFTFSNHSTRKERKTMTITALKRKKMHWKDLNKHWIAEAYDYLKDVPGGGYVTFHENHPSLALISTDSPIERTELASFFIFDGDLSGEYLASTIIEVPNCTPRDQLFFWIDGLVEKLDEEIHTPFKWNDVPHEHSH